MDVFELVKPYLKKIFTEEQMQEFERATSIPTKFEDLSPEQQKIQTINNIMKKWQEKTNALVEYAQNNELDKIKLDVIPTEPFEINAYYSYLVSILQKLYPYRQKDEVIILLYNALHTIIDKQSIIKDAIIFTEEERQKATGNNDNPKEKAINYVNKINWDSFLTKYNTIDYLYQKAFENKK